VCGGVGGVGGGERGGAAAFTSASAVAVRATMVADSKTDMADIIEVYVCVCGRHAW
jgi:hypothetical protein